MKKLLKPNQRAIFEAFTDNEDDVRWSELSEWFLEEFKDNENLIKFAKEKIKEAKKCECGE